MIHLKVMHILLIFRRRDDALQRRKQLLLIMQEEIEELMRMIEITNARIMAVDQEIENKKLEVDSMSKDGKCTLYASYLHSLTDVMVHKLIFGRLMLLFIYFFFCNFRLIVHSPFNGQ